MKLYYNRGKKKRYRNVLTRFRLNGGRTERSAEKKFSGRTKLIKRSFPPRREREVNLER